MATIDDVALQVTDVAEKLAAHERIMQDRYEHLEHGLKKVKSAVSAGKEDDMAGTVNVESTPLGGVLPMLMNQGGGTGAALGGGLGAGLLGGLLGGVLFNRNGVLGGGGVDINGGLVTANQLQTAVNTITANNDTTTIQQTLGDIKASIPLAEGQVQLALQGAQADINRNIDNTGDQIVAQVSAAQLNNANNFAAQSRQISDILAASIANQNSIRSDLNAGVASINSGIAGLATAQLQNTYALNTAIRDAADRTNAVTIDQNEKTRALITAGREADMQRQISDLTNALAEQRADSRVRASEINVTQSVTQNQNQLNLQNQQQQQFQILAQLAASVNNLANDVQAVRQTQSNVNFGVQGNASQTASAANNRVN